MALTLSPEETRILGCLLEKERTTPDQYPLSLNGVMIACNQSTNRDPVTYYEEPVVALGLDDLRGKQLVTQLWGAGSRVQKYRHNLLDAYELNPAEVALLCVLLLRGPQTPGELRTRAGRLHPFASLAEVEETLQGLTLLSEPLVRIVPPQPGQKEKRFVQLLSGEPVLEQSAASGPQPAATPAPTRVAALEAEIAALKAEVTALREEFARFRQQFE